MGQLNQYGDQLIKTSGLHGADISSQRIDDLDQKALEYVLKNQEKNLIGIDAGCGWGIQGIRFALLNAEMHLVDMIDINDRIKKIAGELFIDKKLVYLRKDIKELTFPELPQNCDFVYTQRFIHYLTYQEASRFLDTISKVIKPEGQLFLSASGIGSELGEGYEGKATEIDDRFFTLSSSMASKHNILEKVCLYSEDELFRLLSSYNFKVESIWKSSFGNIKVIAKKV